MLELFITGFIIGLAVAAPVGPIGIICIQRSLHNGFKIGLMSGLGAALADGTGGFVACFGLTAIAGLLITYQNWIRILGGCFLIFLGIKLMLTKPTEGTDKGYDPSAWHACWTTFLLTITNPTTVLAFVAIFAGLGITSQANYLNAIFLVAGITLGSASWWFFLSGLIAFIIHKKINSYYLRIINLISGGIIISFGLIALCSQII